MKDMFIEKVGNDVLISLSVQAPNPVLMKIPLYGLLYNWFVVDDAHGVAPEGYHIPSLSEYNTLINELGGEEIAGGSLKETGLEHWNDPNEGATNESGFTAVGGGDRSYTDGVYLNKKIFHLSWASNSVDPNRANLLALFNSMTYGWLYYEWEKRIGMSIRCMRDSLVGWVEGEKVHDFDGNDYDTVKIGTQVWLKQNLATTHYKDGTAIPEITDGPTWIGLTSGALCAYNNDWSEVLK